MLNEIKSLDELYAVFPNEEAAIDHFRKLRWPNGIACVHCGSMERVYDLKMGKHKCGDCKEKFTVRHDTIFADSKLPLRKWYVAIFLATSHKKGIASAQLARDLKITQKSAWHVLHRIREATKHKSFRKTLLTGTVEMDETYVGGKPRNRHLGHRIRFTQARSGKKIVFGMLQRDGELRLQSVRKIADIKPIIQANVQTNTNVHTDEATHFKWMREPYNWNLVKHSLHEYVRDDVTTNRIEGVFGHFKRSVVGVYHQMSDQHIDRYLSLFAWRWNRREMSEGERVNALLTDTVGHQLTYKTLTRKDERETS